MAEFDKELYMCKAIDLQDGIVKGYLEVGRVTKEYCISTEKGWARVNPYSLCKNTGIKKNDVYIYENDLVEYSTAFDKGLAIIEFDEMRCRYMLRFNLDYSSRGDIDKYNIKVVGNVILSDNDMKRFEDYSKSQSFTKNVEPECRSKAHISKKAKEFLPR